MLSGREHDAGDDDQSRDQPHQPRHLHMAHACSSHHVEALGMDALGRDAEL
jgi:hypothetical protein